MSDEDAKAYWQKWAAKRLENSRRIWLRAAEKALAGDMSELRNRVEMCHAEPMDVVLSEAPPP